MYNCSPDMIRMPPYIVNSSKSAFSPLNSFGFGENVLALKKFKILQNINIASMDTEITLPLEYNTPCRLYNNHNAI